VIAGIRAIGQAGFTGTKIDTVVMRCVNDDELADLNEFGRKVQAEVRFIEYMDVGGATHWQPDAVVSRAEILERLGARHGRIEHLARTDAAPADRFVLADGTTFGIIASTTQPFCADCDRSRVTADGMWYHCLYATVGTNLRVPLRDGASHAELVARIAQGWAGRRDQGAVVRLATRQTLPPVGVEALRRDPHLEMHTRGG
jgi:cyclic pyranopterin phosphate synthase